MRAEILICQFMFLHWTSIKTEVKVHYFVTIPEHNDKVKIPSY